MDCVRMSSQLNLGVTNTLERWHRRSLIMGDELHYIRVVVLEQGLALQGLQPAAAESEERQKSYHAELLEIMVVMLKTSRENEAQHKSGGEQRLPTADTAATDAVSTSLNYSDHGTGRRKEERGGASGADPTRGQRVDREQVWGVGPSGETLYYYRGGSSQSAIFGPTQDCNSCLER